MKAENSRLENELENSNGEEYSSGNLFPSSSLLLFDVMVYERSPASDSKARETAECRRTIYL